MIGLFWTWLGFVAAITLDALGQPGRIVFLAFGVCFAGLVPRFVLYLGGQLVPSVRRRRAEFASGWTRVNGRESWQGYREAYAAYRRAAHASTVGSPRAGNFEEFWADYTRPAAARAPVTALTRLVDLGDGRGSATLTMHRLSRLGGHTWSVALDGGVPDDEATAGAVAEAIRRTEHELGLPVSALRPVR